MSFPLFLTWSRTCWQTITCRWLVVRQNFTSGQAVKESLAAEYSTLHPCLSRRVQSHRSSPWSNSTTNYYYGNLVVLDKVLWLAGNSGVGVHHILVHHCLGSEQRETSRADGQGQDNGKHLRIISTCREHNQACVLLPSEASVRWHTQTSGTWPMTQWNCVSKISFFNLLTTACNRSLSGGFFRKQLRHLCSVSSSRPPADLSLQNIMIHLDDRLWLEVNVSIKCKQKCVLCSHLLSQRKISCRSVFDMVCYLFLGVCQRLIIHQLMAKEVVHVHDLRPPENLARL